MIIFLGILLFFIGVIYILALIMMLNQRHYFKKIFLHVCVFLSYIYIVLNFEKLFKIDDLFSYLKIEFLLMCMILQITIGFFVVRSKHKKRRKEELKNKERLIEEKEKETL